MTNINQRVKFLDVGHGDSSIIYMKDSERDEQKVVILDIVDVDILLKELEVNQINIIELIIISHSDEDHCRGVNVFLEKFLKKGIVKKICYNLDKSAPTKTMRLFLKKFLEIHQKSGIELLFGCNDTSIQERELFSNKKSGLFLIYPNTFESTKAYLQNNTNNASIVCLLKNESCSVIFPGDLESEGWTYLLERYPDLKCQVLKMPHHGAFYEEGIGVGLEEILKVLTPEAAIISSGNNKKYKHPAEKTIKLLKGMGIEIYCTEFTSLCHSCINDFNKKCYGNIEVNVMDDRYEIKAETENKTLLESAECIK